MQQQRQPGSSSKDAALDEHTGAFIPYFAPVSPEDDESVEELLKRYSLQYILERVIKTIHSFPALQHQTEDIALEVYDKFWQMLRRGSIQNPPAYIGRMIHNKCIDHMRRYITEACHIIQFYSEDGLDILESDQVTADGEGLRDPAVEFEYKAALEECYQRITAALTQLSPRKQQAAAWHLLHNVDEPQLLMELFNAFHIDIPEVHPGDKDEEHRLKASYVHARKALARLLDIDLSRFKQTKRCPSPGALTVACTPTSPYEILQQPYHAGSTLTRAQSLPA